MSRGPIRWGDVLRAAVTAAAESPQARAVIAEAVGDARKAAEAGKGLLAVRRAIKAALRVVPAPPLRVVPAPPDAPPPAARAEVEVLDAQGRRIA